MQAEHFSRRDFLQSSAIIAAPAFLAATMPLAGAAPIAIRGCLGLRRRPSLYFFEVNSGSQSQGFLPNTYVDISAVIEKKKSALFAHASQDGQAIWRQHHEIIANWRGREAGVAAAEAFVHLSRDSQTSKLPGI